METRAEANQIAKGYDSSLSHASAMATGIPHADLAVIEASASLDGPEFAVGLVFGKCWFGIAGTYEESKLNILQVTELTRLDRSVFLKH